MVKPPPISITMASQQQLQHQHHHSQPTTPIAPSKKRKVEDDGSVNGSHGTQGGGAAGGVMSPTNKKQRTRVSFSCGECHRRKQKCDRQIPCSHCIARKVPDLCKAYTPGKADQDFNARLTRIEQIIEIALPQYASLCAPSSFAAGAGAGGGSVGAVSSPSSPALHPHMHPQHLLDNLRQGMGDANIINRQGGGGSVPSGSRAFSESEHLHPHHQHQHQHHQQRQDVIMMRRSSSLAEDDNRSAGEDQDPSGGTFQSGKWYGNSVSGSIAPASVLEQIQHVVPNTNGGTQASPKRSHLHSRSLSQSHYSAKLEHPHSQPSPSSIPSSQSPGAKSSSSTPASGDPSRSAVAPNATSSATTPPTTATAHPPTPPQQPPSQFTTSPSQHSHPYSLPLPPSPHQGGNDPNDNNNEDDDDDDPSATGNFKLLVHECGVSPHKIAELLQEMPPRRESDVLVDYYFEAINWTRYPVSEQDFRAAYTSILSRRREGASTSSTSDSGTAMDPDGHANANTTATASNSNGTTTTSSEPRAAPNAHDVRFLPLLFVVLAISTRLAPEHVTGLRDARSRRVLSLRYYWSSRRSLLIAAAIQPDSLDIVLTRLLSARFLTFDRRITECWSQLGAAVRTAQALGLHRDGAKMGMGKPQVEYRRRVWSYLYHADRSYALVLGRPNSIQDDYTSTKPPSNIDDDSPTAYSELAPSLTTPTPMTFVILRHKLASIIGRMVHHFQQVRERSRYADVIALDGELTAFIHSLPPHFALEPDTGLDQAARYIPVHRFLLITEILFVRISLHRPYILRRLHTDRYAPSRHACFESALMDAEVRRVFRASVPRETRASLSNAYREFQTAMIAGIYLVLEPRGALAREMYAIMDGFMKDHEGMREVDETTRRELSTIEFLKHKARVVEQGMKEKEVGMGEEEAAGTARKSPSEQQQAQLLLNFQQSKLKTQPGITNPSSLSVSTTVPPSTSSNHAAGGSGSGSGSGIGGGPNDSNTHPRTPRSPTAYPTPAQSSPTFQRLAVTATAADALNSPTDGGGTSNGGNSPDALSLTEENAAQTLFDHWYSTVSSAAPIDVATDAMAWGGPGIGMAPLGVAGGLGMGIGGLGAVGVGPGLGPGSGGMAMGPYDLRAWAAGTLISSLTGLSMLGGIGMGGGGGGGGIPAALLGAEAGAMGGDHSLQSNGGANVNVNVNVNGAMVLGEEEQSGNGDGGTEAAAASGGESSGAGAGAGIMTLDGNDWSYWEALVNQIHRVP